LSATSALQPGTILFVPGRVKRLPKVHQIQRYCPTSDSVEVLFSDGTEVNMARKTLLKEKVPKVGKVLLQEFFEANDRDPVSNPVEKPACADLAHCARIELAALLESEWQKFKVSPYGACAQSACRRELRGDTQDPRFHNFDLLFDRRLTERLLHKALSLTL
jgi:hypothetical protein